MQGLRLLAAGQHLIDHLALDGGGIGQGFQPGAGLLFGFTQCHDFLQHRKAAFLQINAEAVLIARLQRKGAGGIFKPCQIGAHHRAQNIVRARAPRPLIARHHGALEKHNGGFQRIEIADQNWLRSHRQLPRPYQEEAL